VPNVLFYSTKPNVLFYSGPYVSFSRDKLVVHYEAHSMLIALTAQPIDSNPSSKPIFSNNRITAIKSLNSCTAPFPSASTVLWHYRNSSSYY